MLRETRRKLIHIAFGGLAFWVPDLGPGYSVLLILAAVLWNVVVLGKNVAGPWLWRPGETAQGYSVGILSYPISLLVLALVFWHDPEVVAATWGILAFGDGPATLFGARYGRVRLPWNPRKSWVGLVSYCVFGGLAAVVLLVWTRMHASSAEVAWPFLAAVAGVTVLLSALLESLPQNLDDNVAVPILTALVLSGLLSTEGYWPSEFQPGPFATALTLGFGFNLVLGFFAHAARAIDISGVVAGVLLGTVIHAFLGWRGFLLLGAFFLLGTAASRLGVRQKMSRGLAQEDGGRRSARHAFANASVPACFAVFATTTPDENFYLPAFVAAFAAAASDTLESEIGQIWGGTPVLLTTLEPVPPGTNGAVSLVGSLAGMFGSATLAVLGWMVGFYGMSAMVLVAVGGYLGSLFDSLLGATLERRNLLDNEAVNALSTLAGGLATMALIMIFS